jgi:opacity protein-like surface antigen
MKKLILPLLVAGALAVPSLALAESYYVSVSSGLNLLKNSTIDYEYPDLFMYPPYTFKYKPGVAVNGAVGLKSGVLRLEAEVGFHDNKVDEIIDNIETKQHKVELDLSAWTFMANGYYDIDMFGSGVKPYLMGGLGSARVSIHNPVYGMGTSVTFAWQVGAGLGIKASKDITIDLGYRYLKPSTLKENTDYGIGKYTFGGSEILAGLRFAL